MFKSSSASEKLIHATTPTHEAGDLSLPFLASYWSYKARMGINFAAPFNIEQFNSFVLPRFGRTAKILDFGCGYGRILKNLRELGYHNIHGVDHAEGMIARAVVETSDLDIKLIKNNKVPFSDNSFDVVVLFSVLTCVINDADQKTMIDEIKRLLKPGGIIYLSDYLVSEDASLRNCYARFVSKYGIFGVFEFEDGGPCRDHELDWIKQLFSDFSFMWLQDGGICTLCGSKARPFQLIAQLSKKCTEDLDPTDNPEHEEAIKARLIPGLE